MKNFLRKLFSRKVITPEYSLGVIPNIPDSRDIHIATVQTPVALPLAYKTDISMFDVLNQQAWGTCLWQMLRVLRQQYWYKKTGEVVRLSARSGYILSKQQDGIPSVQGTYMRVAASVLTKQGIAEDSIVPDNNLLPYDQYLNFPVTSENVAKNMSKYVLGGYVSVPADFTAIKQAIYQNGVIGGVLDVDTNWFVGIIAKIFSSIGRHATLWYGYDAEGIFARNSWGSGWVAQLAKALHLPAGDFYFKWQDYKDNCYDITAFVDVPKHIMDNIKSLRYYFPSTMKFGDTGPMISQLQNRLDAEGFWPVNQPKTGRYGPVTSNAVLEYQIKNRVDDIDTLKSLEGQYVGVKTLRALNKETKLDLISALIMQESRGNDYAIGDKGLIQKAYGPLQIRQPVCDDVNKKYGLSRKSEDMLGNRELSIDTFNKYMSIYCPNGTDEDKARTWNGGPNWRAKPAATENYWESVHAMLS